MRVTKSMEVLSKYRYLLLSKDHRRPRDEEFLNLHQHGGDDVDLHFHRTDGEV